MKGLWILLVIALGVSVLVSPFAERVPAVGDVSFDEPVRCYRLPRNPWARLIVSRFQAASLALEVE